MSLNAIDFTASVVEFTYLAHPDLGFPEAVLPSSGPSNGQTLVAVRRDSMPLIEPEIQKSRINLIFSITPSPGPPPIDVASVISIVRPLFAQTMFRSFSDHVIRRCVRPRALQMGRTTSSRVPFEIALLILRAMIHHYRPSPCTAHTQSVCLYHFL